MRSSAAARRYARALFALAREGNQVEEVRGELDALAKLLEESPELHHALFRPLHPVAQRRKVLRSVCERLASSDTVRNFCAFLVDQRRLVDFPAICAQFGQLADAEAGRTEVEVVTATPLRAGQRARLRSALTARTGKQVQLTARVDPALVGGAVAKLGDLLFDGSLRTQLVQLRATLTKGQ